MFESKENSYSGEIVGIFSMCTTFHEFMNIPDMLEKTFEYHILQLLHYAFQRYQLRLLKNVENCRKLVFSLMDNLFPLKLISKFHF